MVGVAVDGGDEYRAPLVIAADGRHSKLPSARPSTESTLLSYTVAPALAGDLLPLAGTGHVFVGAPGPILAYPYGHHRVRMVIDIPLGVTHGRESIAGYVREHYAAHVPMPPAEGDAPRRSIAGPLPAAQIMPSPPKACAVPGARAGGRRRQLLHPLTATGA